MCFMYGSGDRITDLSKNEDWISNLTRVHYEKVQIALRTPQNKKSRFLIEEPAFI